MENELLERGMHVKKHRPQHCYQCVADNLDGRDEATRTPDPYVPNVVRYQLRYIPCIVLRVQRYGIFLKQKQFYKEKFARPVLKTYLCTRF